MIVPLTPRPPIFPYTTLFRSGDELALILPESRLADAQRLAARIEQAVIARPVARAGHMRVSAGFAELQPNDDSTSLDRKSTRLNSSHANISYAVFCLKKKKDD